MNNIFKMFHKRLTHLFLISILFFACGQADQNRNAKVVADQLLGIPITYDARPANLSQVKGLIADFTIAYFKQDREGLSKVLSPNFRWHLHTGALHL